MHSSGAGPWGGDNGDCDTYAKFGGARGLDSAMPQIFRTYDLIFSSIRRKADLLAGPSRGRFGS